jgi:nucleotide-binding universal stress UspA family protein
MIRSILVPLDGSEFAEWALPAAVSIATRTAAKLELVSVNIRVPASVSAHIPGYGAAWKNAARDRALDYLRSMTNRIAKSSNVATHATVHSGAIVDSLVQHAGQAHVDLVVMSTHGRGPLQRMWLGSVADGVVRHSPVPVLLIHPREGRPPDPAGDHLFGRVLVPLDGSGYSEEVLPWAVALGELGGADYTLLEIIQPPMVLGPPYGTFPPPRIDDEQLRAQRLASKDYLEGVADRLRTRELRVETTVRDDASTAHGILDQADQNGTEVIAMSTHGRGGLGRVFLGSVADKVVRGATIPVLVLRPGGVSASM